MSVYDIVFYADGRNEEPVRDFLRGLDPKARMKAGSFIELLKSQGPWLRRPYADKVRGDLYELRVRFSSNEIRILYAFVLNLKIVFLHALLKKTRALKEEDMSLAESRLRNFRARYETEH